MWKAYRKFWINGTKFKGAAERSEFWWPLVINTIISIFFGGIGMFLMTSGMRKVPKTPGAAAPIYCGLLCILAVLLYFYISLVPRYSVMVRRLHDAGFSGWYVWGYIVIKLVLMTVAIGSGFAKLFMPVANLSVFVDSVLALDAVIFVIMAIVMALPAGFHQTPFITDKSSK